MKLYYKYTIGIFTFIITLVFILGCEKKETYNFPVNYDLNSTAQVQVYLATVNATRNYVYVDGKPITGATIATGGLFPSGSGAVAAAIPAGDKSFLIRDTISTATQIPLSFAQRFQGGKSYTIFVYDTITAPKQKTVETNIVIPSDSTARLRMSNFVYNPTATPAVDVFSYMKNANVFTNVQVTDVTNFIPYASGSNVTAGVTDTLYIRETGTMNQIIKFAISLTKKRSYTVILRGSYRSPTKVATLFTNY